MAARNARAKLYNRIWLTAILLVVLVLTLVGAGGLLKTSVALEQKVRCGQEEHIHSEECYMGDVLVCMQKMHVHDEDCYLLLLEDNDINFLMEAMDTMDDKSLESVLSSAISQALVFNDMQRDDPAAAEETTQPEVTEPTRLTTDNTEDIATLNVIISEKNIQPTVVLNENLSTGPNTLALNNNVQTMAVDAPGTGEAGMYIWLIDEDGNGSWVCIGNMTMTRSGNRYTISRSDVLEVFETETVCGNLSNSNLYYSTYVPTEEDESGNRASSGTITFYSNAAEYFFLTTRSSSWTGYTYDAFDFYQVTLDRSEVGGTTQTQYILSGQDSTLTLDTAYQWENAAGKAVDAGDLENITSSFTLYAKSSSATVTYYDADGNILRKEEDLATNTTYTVYDMGDDYRWTANNGYTYEGGQPITLTGDMTFTANVYRVMVDGVANWVKDGQTLTLSEGYRYTDDEGNEYVGQIEVQEPMTLTGAPITYTVTYYDLNGNLIATNSETVNYNGSHTVKETLEGCRWTDGVSTYNAGDTITNIKKNIELTAKRRTYTVTYVVDGKPVKTIEVEHGGSVPGTDVPSIPGKVGHDKTPPAWNKQGNNITSDTTITATYTINTYNLTFNDGTTTTQRNGITHGEQITQALPAGYSSWQDEDGNIYPETFTVTADLSLTAITDVSAAFIDSAGNTLYDTITEIPGATITLPTAASGYVWVDGDGNVYHSGDSVVLNQSMVFTQKAIMQISYDVNFPTSASGYASAVTMPAAPTLTDGGPDTVAEGGSTLIRNVSDREVLANTNHGAGFKYVFYFEGWQTADGTLIQPDANLSWVILQQYADTDGNVQLTGKWSHGPAYVANFCIRYDSVTGSGDNTTGKYTPSLWTSYVGGTIDTSFTINESTDDKISYENDQTIRAMYGEEPDVMWLYSFPSDTYIFEQLKNYTDNLTVDGENVKANELNSDHYAIRWYTVKYVTSGGHDGWHIDGKLVKREGHIKVTKTFGGDTAAIEAAKENFSITAQVVDEDGNLITGTDARTEILTLDQATLADGVYTWTIENVGLGEYWKISEDPVEVVEVDDVVYTFYAEYSVYDTDGEKSAIAEYGTDASAIGKTFALDEDPDQGLMVDFKNYYYPTGSILIKKEDADTGEPIGGAVFELWQYLNGANNPPARLSFDYDADTGLYERNEDNAGAVTQITTASDGFSIISTTGFSYDAGDVIVKEVEAPSGYDAAPSVVLTQTGTGDDAVVSISKMYFEDEQLDGSITLDYVDAAEYADYAEVPENSVMVVKDRTTYYTSVTAIKEWDATKQASSVEVVLQANGQNAASVFPGMTNVQVVLNADNGWTHTWSDLPAYANGEVVEWSLKEVKVGDEATMADGVTFANWIASYDPPVKTDEDGDGHPENWSITVQNTVRRQVLYLTKTDMDGAAVADATFTFQEVVLQDGQWVTTGVLREKTTGANGTIIFDNLVYDAYYLLTESGVPSGYYAGTESVVLSINGAGVVRQVTIENGQAVVADLNDPYISYTNPYNILVKNLGGVVLPETGGIGTTIYMQAGLLLILAAMALLLYRKLHRREDDPSYV